MTAVVAPPAPQSESNLRSAVKTVTSNRAFPAITLAGICAVAAYSEAGADDGQVLCPYRLATGGWCPGCGCTRALGAFVRGDVGASFAYNPWTMILLVQATAIVTWMVAAPAKAKAWWRRHANKVLMANLAVGVVIWAARLVTGVIPLPFG